MDEALREESSQQGKICVVPIDPLVGGSTVVRKYMSSIHYYFFKGLSCV